MIDVVIIVRPLISVKTGERKELDLSLTEHTGITEEVFEFCESFNPERGRGQKFSSI